MRVLLAIGLITFQVSWKKADIKTSEDKKKNVFFEIVETLLKLL